MFVLFGQFNRTSLYAEMPSEKARSAPWIIIEANRIRSAIKVFEGLTAAESRAAVLGQIIRIG